jgi:hypothetical protein
MAALLGAQTPEVEYRFGYTTPSLARRLRFGVTIVESPKDGKYAPMSSVTNQRILGRSGKVIVFSADASSAFFVVELQANSDIPKRKRAAYLFLSRTKELLIEVIL